MAGWTKFKDIGEASGFSSGTDGPEIRARLHEHKAAGSICVQANAGHIRMHVEGKVFDLPAGHLLALEPAIAHDVEALEDSAFLLTIAWPDETEKV